MRRAVAAEIAVLVLVVAAQGVLFGRLLHTATNYDEDVYLAAVDALRHGQTLGSQVFAAQFPGFYDLLRGLSFLTGIGVASLRAGVLAITLAGTVGGWLVGRRFAGALGGLLVAALLVIAPPLDLFGWQVLADPPVLALALLALGLATLPGAGAALAAGAVFGAAFSVKLTALTATIAIGWLVGRRIPYALAGFAAVVGAVLLAHVRALGPLWASGVTYHEKARSTPSVIPHPYRQIFEQIPRTTPFFALAILAVVVAVACLVLRRPLGVWPIWSWVLLALAFLFAHKPLHYNHLIEFPFTLAVAAGTTLAAALTHLSRAVVRVAAVAAALVLAAAYVQQLHRVDLARTPEPASNVAAAYALARLTPSGSLTVDDRPIVSFLARRRVVGQLVDLAFLRWETGSLTDAEVIRDLGPARAVVVSRALRARPRVLGYVRSHFALVYTRGGVAIYRR